MGREINNIVNTLVKQQSQLEMTQTNLKVVIDKINNQLKEQDKSISIEIVDSENPAIFILKLGFKYVKFTYDELYDKRNTIELTDEVAQNFIINIIEERL